jgi:hypothetical protein
MGPYPVDRPERIGRQEQELFSLTVVQDKAETFCHSNPSSDCRSVLWGLGKAREENRATSSVCETQQSSSCSFHHSTYEELDSRAFSLLSKPFNSSPHPDRQIAARHAGRASRTGLALDAGRPSHAGGVAIAGACGGGADE